MLIWAMQTATVIILWQERLIGLVVNASPSRAEDPEFNSHLRCGDF